MNREKIKYLTLFSDRMTKISKKNPPPPPPTRNIKLRKVQLFHYLSKYSYFKILRFC